MKKLFIQSKYLILFILLSISYSLHAQDSPLTGNAPITTAATAVVCPSSTITVPVTVTGFTTITAMTLRIRYDSTIMTYNNSLTSFNSLLTGGQKWSMWDSTGTLCAVMIAWSNTYPVTLPDGSTIITLGFNYINGTTSLHFINTSPVPSFWDCAYAGGFPPATLNDIPSSTYYHDGQVSSGVVGGTVTGGSNITFNQPTGTLTLSGYVGNVVKWQKQYDGEGYVDITNTNTTYSETPIYTGTWDYRAVVQYGSCPQATSTPTTVIVSASGNAKTWTGTESTDWKTPANWSPPGIPMLTENVSIPSSAPHMPEVFYQGMGCNNLSVAGNGGSLTINPGFHLNINGTLNIGP